MRRNIDILTYAPILHSLIRNMLLSANFEIVHRNIACNLFPCYESISLRSVLPLTEEYIHTLADYLYQDIPDDGGCSSCVSISVTLQALLFANGVDAELIIGATKSDDKLFSHAWVRLPNGTDIDPSHERIGKTVLQRKTMLSAVCDWAEKVCESG